jgi:hypothetical protein
MNGRNFRKATYSSNAGANCVEVGDGDRNVIVRDTKERNLGNTRTILSVTPGAWKAFTRSLR